VQQELLCGVQISVDLKAVQ